MKTAFPLCCVAGCNFLAVGSLTSTNDKTRCYPLCLAHNEKRQKDVMFYGNSWLDIDEAKIVVVDVKRQPIDAGRPPSILES